MLLECISKNIILRQDSTEILPETTLLIHYPKSSVGAYLGIYRIGFWYSSG